MKDAPTRLMVRDIPLDTSSLPETVVDYTEVKWEAAIDRVTSAASPRQMERVPAGAVFAPMEIVFSIYSAEDIKRFANVLTGLQLVEDDYLGGQGSRGSGKVRFEALHLILRGGKDYQDFEFQAFNARQAEERNLATLVSLKQELQTWLTQSLKL
jgi:CRISPR-associated protein Csm3